MQRISNSLQAAPDLSLEAAATLSTASVAEHREFASGDSESLEREVIYRNGTGKEFRGTVSDILAEVVMHGSYHRGQIARLTREVVGRRPLRITSRLSGDGGR